MSFAAVIDWNVVSGIAGSVAALLAFIALLYQWLSKKKVSVLTQEELARDRNYLHELQSYLTRYQPAPLRLERKQEIESTAEIKAAFNILAMEDRPGPPPKGTLTRDLASRLIRANKPWVVLGEPGSGKSVTLRRAAADILTRELKRDEPRLPVYVRMGAFTAPLDPPEFAFREYLIQALRNTGVHGARISELFPEYLRQGRFIFLLDGIDEMPRADFGKRFDAVTAEVKNSDANVFVLACRSYDFRELLPVTVAEIRPFDESQIRRFLRSSLGKQEGNRVAEAILRVDGALRDMASSPFFLKLISQYAVSTGGSLPQSRAEVLRGMEEVLLRDQADSGQALKAVLARLAFLMTSGGTGVTLPESTLRKNWEPAIPGKEALGGVIDDAIRLNLLMTEGPASNSDRILTFSHHRLQEYYTAQYLNRFAPPLDWSTAFENIWWRETMILLFGISDRPMDTLKPLIGSIPGQPILIPQLAETVRKGLLALRRPGSVEQAAGELRALDGTGFYGIQGTLTGEDAREQLASALSWILGPGINSMAPDALAGEISAEPDRNEAAQTLRSWLRIPQQRLLDRLELAVDCVRNGRQFAAADLEFLVRPLAAIIEGGNDGEKVQAIEIVARIPRFDAYSAVEPALMGSSAWPRREALIALMEARIGFQRKQSQLPLLLFLQFIKGETLTVLPKYTRACFQSPRLLRLAPVIAVLGLFSLAGAVLPAAIPVSLAAAYPAWGRWIWIPAVPLTAWLYYRKLKYSEPIVFRALLAIGLLAIGPALSVQVFNFVNNAGVPRHFALLIAAIVFAAALLLPQLIELAATLTAALFASLLSLSPHPVSAWLAYSRDSVFARQTFQIALLFACGAYAAYQFLAGTGVYAVLGASWLANKLPFVRILGIAAEILFLALIFGIALWEALKKGRAAVRDPRAAIGELGRRAIGFGKGAALLGCGCLGLLFAMVLSFAGYQVSAGVVRSHQTAVWISTVTAVAFVSVAILLRALLGGVLRPRADERDDYERMTPAERLDSDWQALSKTTSKWERTFRYLRIARANRATRQDRSAALNPGESKGR